MVGGVAPGKGDVSPHWVSYLTVEDVLVEAAPGGLEMIKLLEFKPTRSARVKWLFDELGVRYETAGGPTVFGSPELREVHPLGKLPAVVDDQGRAMFESAAICTYFADVHADRGLIPATGTWERAQHEQWVSFGLAEMENYLWLVAQHAAILPEDQRLPQIIPWAQKKYKAGAAVLDRVLGERPWLTGEKFQVTDIIVGYTINWGRYSELNVDFDNLNEYNQRLFAREHCTLSRKRPG